ncbi:hypothetical protein [Tessaracoccus antarcticus]|uniref:Carboxypeptidase regulatory-like domain-containing protein n=1 Tax=Tessaracoccus antarcticus TaxID=2479848 RepID=A0A3M0GQQ3_9ACTN|nr:hypothetical protein [Tessaracoccus antarcticus]RMB59616.1 hypothetical protein EAX62_07500 [Tessaracoccus antarcticus]
MNASLDPPMDGLDEMILGQLACLFDAVDPPPAGLADDVLFTLSLAALDAELATLADASALQLRTSAASPSDTVTFTSSALQLMVSATPDGDGLRIDGWITGGGLRVELIAGTTSWSATSDVNGRLVWHGVPHGAIRFLMHRDDEGSRTVLTPLIEL